MLCFKGYKEHYSSPASLSLSHAVARLHQGTSSWPDTVYKQNLKRNTYITSLNPLPCE